MTRKTLILLVALFGPVLTLLPGCQSQQKPVSANAPDLYLARQEIANRIIASEGFGTIHVQAPESLLAGTTLRHRIYIRDTSGGDGPTVIFTPNIAEVVTDDPLVKNPPVTAYDIPADKLLGLDAVDLLVIAGAAKSIPFDDAVASGSVVRRRFHVEHPNAPDAAAAQPDGATYLSTSVEVMTDSEARDLFGENFAKAFYACKVLFHNQTQEELILDGASVTTDVRWLLTKQDAADVLDDGLDSLGGHIKTPERASQYYDEHGPIFKYMDWGMEPRRPLAFSDIIGIFDYQRLTNNRQEFVNILQFLGMLATGAEIFINHTDYAAGVAYFNGLALPEFSKLVLNDILFHLDKLHQRSLKEIERLPAGATVDRVVFFTRGPITGIHPTKPVYIAEIGPGAQARAVAAVTFGNEEEREKVIESMILKEVAQRHPEIWDLPFVADAGRDLQEIRTQREAEREQKKQQDAARRDKRAREVNSAVTFGQQLLDKNPNLTQDQKDALRLLLDAARQDIGAAPETPADQ